MLSIFYLITLIIASTFESVSIPDINFSKIGSRIGVFGSFDSLSYYSYHNASSFLQNPNENSPSNSSSNSNNLYVRDSSKNYNLKFGNTNGDISQILPLSEDTVIITGNFSKFNDKSFQPPIIYNITSGDVSLVFPSSSSKRDDTPSIESGEVSVMYVDEDLIYLGGDFKFNNTYGAAIYNQTSKQVYNTPFKGFGDKAVVNSIMKINQNNNKDDVNKGSIVFGGDFNTLGLSDLLAQNVSSNSTLRHHKNTNDTSLETAEQIISIKYGTFSNTNGDSSNDDSSIICPSNNNKWSLQPDVGGQWAVELPNEVKGVYPTKARLYVPDDEDSVQLFRIYSYPNNGIMNLSYIDPDTNDIAYCDAWCPMKKASELKDYTSKNKKHKKSLTDDMTYVDDEGSFQTYYDDTSKTKVLGYGSNYQEFSFENSVSVDKVGVTIVGWYGSKGALSGFELYSNQIMVYGNDSLNEPNCDDDDDGPVNYSELKSGSWKSVTSLSNSVSNTDYLVSVGTDAELILYPNISYSGNYSILFGTPGCTLDNSCDKRSIVNVSVIDNDDNMLASKLIYQNNNNDKFDYLFYGHLNGTADYDGHNKIKVEYHDTITPGTNDPWVVVDKVTTNVVELDDYMEMNSTNKSSNHSKEDSELHHLKLHSLFEYSIANFTDFDELKVSHKDGDDKIISKKNTFVGNSTLNVLSSKLSSDSKIDELNLNGETISIIGNFKSKSLNLSSDNLISVTLNKYNDTSNQAISEIEKRKLNYDLYERELEYDLTEREAELWKRDDDDNDFTFKGVNFNDSISKVSSLGDASIYLGKFSLSKKDDSTKLRDLSNKNNSVDTANNFAIYYNSAWYSFGNNFSDISYNQVSNLTIDDTEYLVFGADGDNFKTWDNTNSKWLDSDSDLQLNITSAVSLSKKQQILSGSSLNIMDYYGKDQAAITDDGMEPYKFDIEDDGYEIFASYYINNSVSVIGGKFKTSSKISNVGFIDNTSKNRSMVGLNGDIKFTDDAVVQELYVDSDGKYLFIGTNGTATIDGDKNVTGVIIYNLKNNSFTDFQPAELANIGGDSININAIVLYDKGNKLLVGGDFVLAGSLQCIGLCVYDIANTRWMDPASSDKSPSIDGSATDIKFFKSNQVIISGNFTIDSSDANFITYDFDKGMFATSKSSLNKLGSSQKVNKFTINDENDSKLSGRFSALGSDFIVGYDGSRWATLDEGILYTPYTEFTDLKIIALEKDLSSNKNQKYFNKNQALILAGVFELEDYGLVNAALYDGSKWIPYVFSAKGSDQIGRINTFLFNDAYRFLSSDDITNKNKGLSSGKVVGISLACALGSTTLIGLLYIIPYFMLFRKSKQSGVTPQRIEEKEMMNAVNPESLIHEMDLQRNH